VFDVNSVVSNGVSFFQATFYHYFLVISFLVKIIGIINHVKFLEALIGWIQVDVYFLYHVMLPPLH